MNSGSTTLHIRRVSSLFFLHNSATMSCCLAVVGTGGWVILNTAISGLWVSPLWGTSTLSSTPVVTSNTGTVFPVLNWVFGKNRVRYPLFNRGYLTFFLLLHFSTHAFYASRLPALLHHRRTWYLNRMAKPLSNRNLLRCGVQLLGMWVFIRGCY